MLLQGPIYAHDKDGLFTVLDGRALELQLPGFLPKPHNMLYKEDLITIFRSMPLDLSTTSGLQARISFTVEVMTEMQPTSLSILRVKQFEKVKL